MHLNGAMSEGRGLVVIVEDEPAIADVERLRKAGEMTPDAYLIRLKELRQRLADNETALRKAGVTVTAQTFQCPHCGGVLPLGVDKCDYCKQTVLT